ncbi:MAG: calcium-binding protein [Cyanobacteria bacterium K_DeepCast_35m_m1_288]|nr:calcium-binding protein [Cyanobacteria bacterium K_DeepCast_35m_m1_288]
MRILLAVVHYFKPGDGRHGSLGRDPEPRRLALRMVLLQLQRLFGSPAATLNHMARRVDGVVDGGAQIDIRICVTGDNHLLDDLSDLAPCYQAVVCQPTEPRLLGFACHQLLAELHASALAAKTPYDFIGYLEDDILIQDPDFFLKLRQFNRAFGDGYLLMPNRLETMERPGQLARFYIDGDYNPEASVAYRKSATQHLCLEHLGELIRFEQPYNLHSGCFFLNAKQAQIYFASSASRELDVSFHGPLESAATLGMLKTFQLMKPALSNGRFLTVEHAGRNFMGLVPHLG